MKPLSIKWKAALGATALAVALIGIVSAIQVFSLRRDTADLLSAQQFTLASQVAYDLDGKLAGSLNVLAKSAASLPRDILADPDKVRGFFAQRQGMFVVFDDMLLIGTDGQVTADYPELAGRTNVNAADRRYFQQVLATGKPVISEPVIGKLRHEPIVNVAAPVLGPDGKVLAVLTGVLRLQKDNILGHLASAKVGKTGYFYILTKGPEPVFVMHPNRDRILKPRPPGSNPATVRALDGFEGTVEETNSTGVRALFSYKSLKSADWLLVVMLPVDEAFAPIARAERRTMVISAILALLIAPLVWFLVWRLLAPLSRLRDSIDSLRSSPNGFTAVEVVRHDEIGDLAQAFNLLMGERAVAESKQRESEQRIRTITDNVPALVCYIDREHRFLFNNRTYEKWLRRPLTEITGHKVRDVYGEGIYADLEPHITKALSGELVKFEVAFDGDDGIQHHTRGTYVPHRNENGDVVGIHGLITDITQVKEAERQLKMLAQLDSLTGLPNRNQFNERLVEATKRVVANGLGMAVMFLDIDYFKAINDTLGHQGGDEVLKAFALRLREAVRPTDTVARLGGDEFVVILEGLQAPDEAQFVARKIIHSLRPAIHVMGTSRQVTTSIGIAVWQEDDADAAALMRRADEAQYMAKAAGRDTFYLSTKSDSAK